MSPNNLLNELAIWLKPAEEYIKITPVTPLTTPDYAKLTAPRSNILINSTNDFDLDSLPEGEFIPNKASSNKIKDPEGGYDSISNFRKKAKLQPYNLDSGDTVALIEINGNKYFGVNSQITNESQLAQKPLREKWLNEVEWVPPKKKRPKHLGQAQSLTHGESHSLIRAYERNNGQLPKEINMYVDRKTCNICRGEMPALLKRLGVERLNIYSGGSSLPIVLKPAH